MRTAGTERLAGNLSELGELQAELTGATFKVVALVSESDRSRDIAIALSPTRLAVLRYVGRANTEDHTALVTMVSQGDFVWAGLAYSDHPAAEWPGLIEAFHLSDLPRLIDRLKRLQGAEGP